MLVSDVYVASFRPSLMNVAYAWCRGASFREICAMTDIFEGAIVRNFKRTDGTS